MSILPLGGVFESGVFHLPIRVFYEDTDFTGIVYHVNYLKFAERGRTESLRFLTLGTGEGSAHDFVQKNFGLFFAVKDCFADFKRPARIDDMLVVQTRLKPIRGATLDFAHQIFRAGDLLASVDVRVVLLHESDGRLARLPAELKNGLSKLWQQET